jgi:hypothetical protein
MGWNRKQYDKTGRVVPIHKGERDWTREQKEQIRQFEDRNANDQRGTDDDDGTERRKAG